MDRMAIIAKTQKRHEGKSERGGGLQQPSPLLRERVKSNPFSWKTMRTSKFVVVALVVLLLLMIITLLLKLELKQISLFIC